jgi:hypothetical protein
MHRGGLPLFRTHSEWVCGVCTLQEDGYHVYTFPAKSKWLRLRLIILSLLPVKIKPELSLLSNIGLSSGHREGVVVHCKPGERSNFCLLTYSSLRLSDMSLLHALPLLHQVVLGRYRPWNLPGPCGKLP